MKVVNRFDEVFLSIVRKFCKNSPVVGPEGVDFAFPFSTSKFVDDALSISREIFGNENIRVF